MAVNTTFVNWSTSGLDHLAKPYDACSPNLQLIRGGLDARFGQGAFVGCHNDRDIRDGTALSAHAYGAAFDRYYAKWMKELELEWLISNSMELHVQAIHDYAGCRIWRAGRTPRIEDARTLWWREQTPNPNNGMGQAWAQYLHTETTPAGFGDRTPIDTRLKEWKLKPHSARAIDTRVTKQRLKSRASLTVPIGMATEAFIKVSAVGASGPGWLSLDGGQTTVCDWGPESTGDDGVSYVALGGGGVVVTAGPSDCDVIIDVQGLG